VKDAAGNLYDGTSSYEFQTLSNVTPSPTPTPTPGPSGGGSNPSTLVPSTLGQLLSPAALQTNLPEVTPTSLISQYKMGNLTTLIATMNGTNIVDVLSNGTDSISGTINNSGMSTSLSGPAGVSIKMESPAGPGNFIDGSAFINNLMAKKYPGTQINSPAVQTKASIQGGLALIGQQSSAAAVSATKVFELSGVASQPIQIQENLTQTDLAAINLNDMQQAPTIKVNNLTNLLVMGPGTVINAGNTGMNLIGDVTNQSLVGGPANDFLSGGGGIDSLTGGGGIDTFYFGAPGQVTITDFNNSDKLKFNVLGVKSFSDLCKAVTNVVESPKGDTYTINGNLQITIIGYHVTSNWNLVSFQFS
jgi:Ca2+-binding RTX toxin-like protein